MLSATPKTECTAQRNCFHSRRLIFEYNVLYYKTGQLRSEWVPGLPQVSADTNNNSFEGLMKY